MKSLVKISTGIHGLDTVLDNLLLGDNVVWQVDSIEDYKVFVEPFVEKALADGRTVVYMRFATHPPSLTAAIRGSCFINLTPFPDLSHLPGMSTILSARSEKRLFMFLIACLICLRHGLLI